MKRRLGGALIALGVFFLVACLMVPIQLAPIEEYFLTVTGCFRRVGFDMENPQEWIAIFALIGTGLMFAGIKVRAGSTLPENHANDAN